MIEKIDRFTVVFELEKDGALPLPKEFKLQQFMIIDMPHKEQHLDKDILNIAVQKGATKKGLAIIAHRVIEKPNYLPPQLQDDYEIE